MWRAPTINRQERRSEQPEKGGRGKKGSLSEHFCKALLSQARAVVPYPDLSKATTKARDVLTSASVTGGRLTSVGGQASARWTPPAGGASGRSNGSRALNWLAHD
jgi:hypothetical protein